MSAPERWRRQVAGELAPHERAWLGVAALVIARCSRNPRLDPRHVATIAGLRGDHWRRAIAAFRHRGWLDVDEAGGIVLVAPDDLRRQSVVDDLVALFARPDL